MSQIYWMCEGIGIRTNSLFEFLDDEKCIKVIKEQLPNEDLNFNDFDIEDYMFGEPFENLGDFLCHADDSNTMTFADNGNDEQYFLYAPSYPWERRKNEPKTIEEVRKNIIKAVQKVTNLNENEIKELIDEDIYDVGIG